MACHNFDFLSQLSHIIVLPLISELRLKSHNYDVLSNIFFTFVIIPTFYLKIMTQYVMISTFIPEI